MKSAKPAASSGAAAPKPSSSSNTNGNGNAHASGSIVRKHKQIVASSDEDDDAPLSKRPKQSASNGSAAVKKSSSSSPDADDDSSDSDVPLTTTTTKKSASTAPRPASKPRSSSSSSRPAKRPAVKAEPEDSDDEPLGKRSKPSTSKPRASKAKSESPEDDEDDEEEEEEEDGDDDGEDGGGDKGARKHSGDGTQMWNTLYHTGPRFPPPYEPLPRDVKMKYNGKPVDLPPKAEEAALFYAVKLETPYVKDPTFNTNFFRDFQDILKKNPPRDGTKITEFKLCDFVQMCEHQKSLKEAEKERKKKLAPSARKKEQADKKAAEEEMKSCIVDGNRQRVGNVMVEPPALFMGRGQHPKRGQIKPRVQPEEITINHTLKDPKHPPPSPPEGHNWKAVVEMKDVTWLAHWIDFNGNYKYVYLDATSSFKSNSDREKFEKARKLDKCVKKLRKRVEEMLVSKSRQERQLGTVIWLIDNYSLRAGNEKGEDEAATYGVCSLLVEHVRDLIDEENKVTLEFLGKDSMLFKEVLEVPERVFKNIKMFTRSTKDAKGEIAIKKKSDAIFERVDTSDVNKFLRDPKQGGMPGLSAKVFRTYNASTTFQGLLNKTADNLKERGLQPTPQSLKDEYMQANRLVAILCNHQKTVNPQVAERQVARAEEKLVALKYDIHKERQKIFTVHKTTAAVKEEYPAKEYKDFKWDKFLDEDLELTDEIIREHEERTIHAKINRMEAAFERQELEREYQASVKAEKEEPAPKANGKGRGKKAKVESEDEEDDKGRVAKIKTKEEVEEDKARLLESLKVLEKERKTGKSQLDVDSIRVDSCARKIKAKFEQIRKFEQDMESKNKTSDVSLGTSKLNYIDPRCTVSWLKHWDKELQKLDPSGSGSVKKEEQDDKKKVKKGAAASSANGESDKLELNLVKLPIGQYFPMTMQKKFRWADYDDNGRPGLPANWVFVENAEEKTRTNYSSAQKKEIEESLAATRKDDVSRGGKKTDVGKSGAAGEATRAKGGQSAAAKKQSAKKKQSKAKEEEEESDDDSDVPLGKKK